MDKAGRLGSDTADGGTADGVAAGAVADVVAVAGGLGDGTADGPGVAAGAVVDVVVVAGGLGDTADGVAAGLMDDVGAFVLVI